MCFHVNNPGHGATGPYLWTPSNHTAGVIAGSTFNLDQLLATQGYSQEDALNAPDGPVLKLLNASFQIKLSGFVEDTRCRILCVQQKRIDADFWSQRTAGMFLPQQLCNMKRLAGFSPNDIDRRVFRVLADKRIYMNSKGSSNLVDLNTNDNTVDGTTPPTRYCKINLRLNQVCRMLQKDGINDDGDGDTDRHAHTKGGSDHPHNAIWAFDNQHPLKNTWIIISTDDESTLGATFTGDAVGVQIIRKLTWQDHN